MEDAPIWKCLLKCSVKYVYACLVKNNDSLKCLGKWSNELSIQTVVKITFDNVFKTTNDTCLWWFQYRLLYKLLPSGRFLYLRKLVDSPICSLCN